jgi:AMMECR1 domain-containing protein
LLLPQVPEELGWSREQFLDGTCRKAGLPTGCWRDADTRIQSFRAIVWGEDLADRLG